MYADSGKDRVPLTLSATRKQSLQVQPVPRAEWPLLARIVAGLREESDIGIGSTLERMIASLGGEFYKAAFKTLTGKSCGCADRRKYLDERFPYTKPAA